jgi:hypothetical protein
LAFHRDMNCTSCGAPLDSGPFCPSCGARQGGQTAPPADGWQAVGQQVSSVTVAVSTTCTHCAEPVPVNGPSASLHCSHCDQDMPLPVGLGEAIRAASAGYRLVGGVGAAFWVQSGEASPECPRCGQAVSIAAYVDRHGATAAVPCAACGASVPTYPAPAWLKERLPTVLQVFGGDADVAKAAGVDLRVDESRPQPIAMACPSCGGGLTITADAARTVPCPFCKVSVFLPDELWKRLHPVKVMRRWTLTYTGQLETKEEIEERETQRKREILEQERLREKEIERRERLRKEEIENRERRRAEEQAAIRSAARARRRKYLRVGLTVVGVGAAVTGFGALEYYTDINLVHGSMTSESKELGRWTLDDTAWGGWWHGCQSGQPHGFFGVTLFDQSSHERLRLVKDVVRGMTLEFGIPGTDELLVVPGKMCSKLDADVHREGSAVGDITNLEGHVDFDCELQDGRVHGSVTFSNCH